MKKHLPALLLLLAASVVVTWPTVWQLGSAIPGHPTSDTYDHLWGYWWYGWSLAHGQLPIRTTLTHWPPGGLLYFVDPYGAILSLPFQLIFGIGIGYSLTILTTVWSGMASMYLVAHAETEDRPAALLAGIVFGASPYVLGLLQSGTMEYVHIAALPVVWWTMRRALGEGTRRAVVFAALAWVWATLASFYYAAFSGILALVACWDQREHGWAVVGERLASIILVYGAVAAPIFGFAGWTLTSPDAAVSSENAPGWNYATLPATDLLTFVHPGDYVFPDNRDTGNFGIRHVNYLGLVAIALAGWGLYKERRLRLPFAVLMVLALGPTLAFHRDLVFVGGRPVPLPATLLYLPGSPFRFVHHPFRMVAMPMVMIGLAAAQAVRGRAPIAAIASVLVLAEAIGISPAIWPIPTAPWAAPEPVKALKDDASVKGVWDFPPSHHVLNRRYEMLQTFHQKVTPYGTNSFLPQAFKENHFVRAMIQCLKKPTLALIPREGGAPVSGWLDRANKQKIPAGKAAMVDEGYGLVILHLPELAHGEAQCARTLIGGDKATFATEEVEGWALVAEGDRGGPTEEPGERPGAPPEGGEGGPRPPGPGVPTEPPGPGPAGQGGPGQGGPGQGAPGQVGPGQGAPGQGAPGQGAPGQGAPAVPPGGPGAPGGGGPARGAPAQGGPRPASPPGR